MTPGALDPHVQRMVEEHRELLDRTSRLESFITSSTVYHLLDPADRALLQAQHGVMHSYAVILATRIRRAGVVI